MPNLTMIPHDPIRLANTDAVAFQSLAYPDLHRFAALSRRILEDGGEHGSKINVLARKFAEKPRPWAEPVLRILAGARNEISFLKRLQ